MNQLLPEDAGRGMTAHLAAAHALTAKIAEVRGEGADDDELVHAVVGTGGKVHGLTIDPRMMRMASQEIAAHVVAALDAARLDAERQVSDAMTDTLRTNPSWEELLSGEAPLDMAAALPPVPDPEVFDEMIRAARRDTAAD